MNVTVKHLRKAQWGSIFVIVRNVKGLLVVLI